MPREISNESESEITQSSDETAPQSALGCISNKDCNEPSEVCNKALGECVVADCEGKKDFVRCNYVSEPDNEFDICIEGVCVSPGYGGAESNVPGPYFVLPDTNIRACSDASEVINCPNENNYFYGQDAQYGWDVANRLSDRFEKSRTDDTPVITDTVTGLLWQGCTASRSGKDCSEGRSEVVTWTEALDYCETLVWGGYSDWRLPDEYALQSIIDYERHEPAVDETVFPRTPDQYFWSSSQFSNSDERWIVGFQDGTITGNPADKEYHVRCVRGGAPTTRRLTRSVPTGDEPTVKDELTALEWQGCEAGKSGEACTAQSADNALYDWGDALAYCEALVYNHQSDWRLPNINELKSIIDNRTANPPIDTTVFPATTKTGFWSSSPFLSPIYAWRVYFDTGNVYAMEKEERYHVRCVRNASNPDSHD